MGRIEYECVITISADVSKVTAQLLPPQPLKANQYRYKRTVEMRLGPVTLPITYEITLTLAEPTLLVAEANPVPGVSTRTELRFISLGATTRVTSLLIVHAPSFMVSAIAQQFSEIQRTDLDKLQASFKLSPPASEKALSGDHRVANAPTVVATLPSTPAASLSRPMAQDRPEQPTPDHVRVQPYPPIVARSPGSVTSAPVPPSVAPTPVKPSKPTAHETPQPPKKAKQPSIATPPAERPSVLLTPPGAQPPRNDTAAMKPAPSLPLPEAIAAVGVSAIPLQNAQPTSFQLGETVRSRHLGSQGTIVRMSTIRDQVFYTVTLGDEEHTLPENDIERVRDVLDRLAEGAFGYASDFDLYAHATAIQCAFQQRGMSCLSNSRLDPRPHQVFVAHRVLQDLYPRYLLADEVGLGKTIEAGLILKELKARGVAERILIIVPASLCEQWRGELATKFNENFVIHNGALIRDELARNPHANPWSRHSCVIASLQFARGQISPAHRDSSRGSQAVTTNRWIDEVEWDLVIFDEAHHLRRRLKSGSIESGRERTQSYRLAQALEERTRSLLLLTATPLQLSEYDAFSLFELIDPTIFQTYEEFCEYVRRLGHKQWQSIAELDRTLHALGSTKEAEANQKLGGLFQDLLIMARSLAIYDDFWNSLIAQVGGTTTIGSAPHYTLLAIRHSYSVYFEAKDWQKALTTLTAELEQHGLKSFLYTYRDTIFDWISRQHKLSQLMIRNRKRQVLRGEIVDRHAYIVRVSLTPEELELYNDVSDYIKNTNARITGKNVALGFLITTFRKLLVSSRFALAASFERRAQRLELALQKQQSRSTTSLNDDEIEEFADLLDTAEDLDELFNLTGSLSPDDIRADILLLRSLAQRARSIHTDSKGLALLTSINSILSREPQTKILIFTQFRQTQAYLCERLEQAGYRVALFHGEQRNQGYSKREEFARFKRDPSIQIMISTDVGGEGLNFQFCHVLFNYDLPWNPMNIEQRIGRIDRIGQKYDVDIYNFYLDETIDGRILQVLQERIRIFEETIGTLDPIIGEEIEGTIRSIALASNSVEAEKRLQELAEHASRRIREAHEAEEKMADFVMDARSFRRDTVDQVLGRPQSVTNAHMETLTRAFLKRYQLFGRPDLVTRVAEHIYRITVPLAFRDVCKKQYGIDLSNEYTGTFHPPTAIAEETIDFFAFGHPLFDMMIRYATDRAHSEFHPESALRIVYSDQDIGFEGVQLNYLIIADGVRTYRSLAPVILSRTGAYDEAQSKRIFDLPADEKAAEGQRLAFDIRTLRALKQHGQRIIDTIAASEFEAAEQRNLLEFAEVHAKVRRGYEYRLAHQRRELAWRKDSLEEAKQRKVENRIRLMQGQVHATERRIRELEDQRDTELATIAGQHELRLAIKLLNVALVRVLPRSQTVLTA